MNNIKKYDDFVNESKLDDQLKGMFNTTDGEGIYYETISPDDDNSTIELGLIEPEFGNDKQMFNEFKKNYEKNKHARVICATCGCADLQTIDIDHYEDDTLIDLESNKLNIKYIKKYLLNADDDQLLFPCGCCQDETSDFLYKGRYYHYIRNPKEKPEMSIGKKLLVDIVNDVEK